MVGTANRTTNRSNGQSMDQSINPSVTQTPNQLNNQANNESASFSNNQSETSDDLADTSNYSYPFESLAMDTFSQFVSQVNLAFSTKLSTSQLDQLALDLQAHAGCDLHQLLVHLSVHPIMSDTKLLGWVLSSKLGEMTAADQMTCMWHELIREQQANAQQNLCSSSGELVRLIGSAKLNEKLCKWIDWAAPFTVYQFPPCPPHTDCQCDNHNVEHKADFRCAQCVLSASPQSLSILADFPRSTHFVANYATVFGALMVFDLDDQSRNVCVAVCQSVLSVSRKKEVQDNLGKCRAKLPQAFSYELKQGLLNKIDKWQSLLSRDRSAVFLLSTFIPLTSSECDEVGVLNDLRLEGNEHRHPYYRDTNVALDSLTHTICRLSAILHDLPYARQLLCGTITKQPPTHFDYHGLSH